MVAGEERSVSETEKMLIIIFLVAMELIQLHVSTTQTAFIHNTNCIVFYTIM